MCTSVSGIFGGMCVHHWVYLSFPFVSVCVCVCVCVSDWVSGCASVSVCMDLGVWGVVRKDSW